MTINLEILLRINYQGICNELLNTKVINLPIVNQFTSVLNNTHSHICNTTNRDSQYPVKLCLNFSTSTKYISLASQHITQLCLNTHNRFRASIYMKLLGDRLAIELV